MEKKAKKKRPKNMSEKKDLQAVNALKKRIEERTKELEKSLSLVRATLESTADGILLISNEGKLVDWNQKFIDLLSVPQSVLDAGLESNGINYVLSQIEDPKGLMELMQKVAADPEIRGDVGEMYFKDGRIFGRYSQPHRLGNKVVGRVWSFRDVTEQRKAEDALRLRERAIEASTHGVIIANAEEPYSIIYVNPAFERITGYKKNEAIGKTINFLSSDQNTSAEDIKIRMALRAKREVNAILHNRRKDNILFWNELHIAPVPNAKGQVSHFIGIVVDITQRKKMEEQLLHQATHDALTDLPNRSLFRDRLEQAIFHSTRSSTIIGILFLDLDRFKLVNDSLGHSYGDILLQVVSDRIQKCVRKTDTVARVGGDEFIIISPNHKKIEDIIPLAQKVLKQLSYKFNLPNHELNISTSIGISIFPIDGRSIESLMKNADIAMYQAKEKGRNNFQFYTPEMNKILTERLELEKDLHLAIINHEFELVYQPLICLNTEKIIGFEALLRWHHPTKGMLPPTFFIPVTEETGMIIPIGKWVLKTACTQLKFWLDKGLAPLQMAINISSKQIKSEDFAQYVYKTVKNHQLDPNNIELELTESLLMEDSKNTTIALNNLHNLGIKFVIDDFGIGYSSLSYIGRLPVYKLKIDRSFITNIMDDSQNTKAIIQTIIAMGKNLNLKVLAEGVEFKEQATFLKEHDCNQAQGFYSTSHLVQMIAQRY